MDCSRHKKKKLANKSSSIPQIIISRRDTNESTSTALMQKIVTMTVKQINMTVQDDKTDRVGRLHEDKS